MEAFQEVENSSNNMQSRSACACFAGLAAGLVIMGVIMGVVVVMLPNHQDPVVSNQEPNNKIDSLLAAQKSELMLEMTKISHQELQVSSS